MVNPHVAEYWNQQSDGRHRQADEAHFEKYANELLFVFPKRGVLLDVGCGSADLLAYMAPHFHHCFGIEPSDSMRDAAQQRIERFGLKNVTLLRGSATEFPAEVKSADLVMSNGVIQYLTHGEIEHFLRLAKRVLTPQGMVGIGSVPWSNLKHLYRTGGLRGEPSAPWRTLLRYARYWTSPARLKQLREGNILHDGIGHWFSYDEMKELAGREGFNCEILNCLYYEYRFHAVLTPARPVIS